MLSILNRALSWAITSFGNKFCLKMRSRLIKASDNRFYVKFMQLEMGLLKLHKGEDLDCKVLSVIIRHLRSGIRVRNFINLHIIYFRCSFQNEVFLLYKRGQYLVKF